MYAVATHQNDSSIARDASGFAVFAGGAPGAAHVRAHIAADRGDMERGRRELGAWLASHRGRGSDWVHLHFHMALFELACGDWDAAHRRFQREILPAVTSFEAFTDAPALLWRLSMCARDRANLPWMPLRDAALRNLGGTDAFVEMHHLLALAGAGDEISIRAWLRQERHGLPFAQDRIARRFAAALVRLVRGQHALCADLLEALLPSLAGIGGSNAQNQLFRMLCDWCRMESTVHTAIPRKAA